MPSSAYDRIAPRYDAGVGWLERWFLGDLRQKAFEQLPHDGRVLEIGAGTGLNFRYYHDEAHVVASEPSREMLRMAAIKPKPRNMSLVRSCVEEIPFVDASFDAALGTLVFCSVNSPERGFAELKRVLKPGGKLVLVEHVRPPGVLGPLFDLGNLITAPVFDDHLNRRTAETVRAAGFKIETVECRARGIITFISAFA